MSLLKENGSLDVERIRALPIDEYMEEITHFSKAQHQEYVSKLPVKEPSDTRKIVHGSLKEDLESGKSFDMREVVNNIGKR